MSKHHARKGALTVADIRRRLRWEAVLPPGVQPNPESMLRYYGVHI